MSNNKLIFAGIAKPFRYSDDLNRFLLTVMIVLLPGRFIAEAMVDMVRLAAQARR